MQFRNAQGHRLVISKSISCTVKNTGKYSQKAVESSLLIEKHGERTTISGKQMQLDEAVPMYMGVSPAILENVIFCHQEEASWPMSEPSKLKVKFDEIFEAQKYQRAIDSLIKKRK